MADDLFFSNDMKSLRRGQRIAQRTPACRPCLLWVSEDEGQKYYGVILDINKFGMRIRMMDLVPPGSVVMVQMMKDEEYQVPLAKPVEATVVRTKEEDEGLRDHGLRLVQKEVPRLFPKRLEPNRKPVSNAPKTRMYSLDITIGKEPRRRFGR